MKLEDLLQRTFLGNTVLTYLFVAAIIIGGLLLQRLISKLLARFIFKFIKTYSAGVGFNKLLVLIKKPIGVLILLLTFFFAFDLLNFPQEWKLISREHFGIRMVLFRSFQVSIVFAITWIILRIIDFFGLILQYKASLTESKTDDQLVPFVKEFIKIIIVIFSVFFILGTIFELNITSLIAGLGIGGLAIALAAKESLENLLGSFTIFLDRPFVVGDMVKIGGVQGNVERIGFRSTRIRTVDKSFVTVPNKKMVEAELDNLTLKTFQRASFNISLRYDTSEEKLKAIIKEIETYINHHPKTNKEGKVKFLDFTPNALQVMVLYFVDSLEWDIYADVREEINFKIIQIVRRHGTDFAYPTTTIHVEKLPTVTT